MGFLDKIFGGRSPFSDKREAALVCELTLCGKKYLLSEFDLMCNPEQKEYLSAYAVFLEPLENSAKQWITRMDRKENLRVRFYRNENNPHENAHFELYLTGAHCIRYHQTLYEGQPVETLVMTMRNIVSGSNDFEMGSRT